MAQEVRIRILGEEFEADGGDTILFTLRLFGVLKNLPEDGFKAFCWQADCHQCLVEVDVQGACGLRFACRTAATDGLVLRTLPEVLKWGHLIRSAE